MTPHINSNNNNPNKQEEDMSTDIGHGTTSKPSNLTEDTIDDDEDLAASSIPNARGTKLEAAFVDPAYSWPPKEGEGKNAIELQASAALLTSVEPDSELESEEEGTNPQDDDSGILSDDTSDIVDPEPPKIKKKTRVVTTTETTTTSRCGFLRCCKSEDAVVSTAYEDEPIDEEETERLKVEYKQAKAEARRKRKEKALKKQQKALDLQKEKEEKARLKKAKAADRRARKEREKKLELERYSKVPEGILIYRLDTSERTVTLVSGVSSNTDVDNLLKRMVVAEVSPSDDKTRRGICLVGVDGTRATLLACEQRTAIAWLEAMQMMLGNAGPGRASLVKMDRAWAAEEVTDEERNAIEEQYLNLAAYSNNLIRAGAIPGSEADDEDNNSKERSNSNAANKKKFSGGIYYSVEKIKEEGDQLDDETLESIAKRRAVIKDSWDFYRMICSLLRDRRKYDEVFRRMQLDSVYPYLNSMTGLNDPGDDGYETSEKNVTQRDHDEYADMTRTAVCQDLVKKAEEALPSLVEICKALAGSLGMEEVGVGPVKEVSAAIRKAEKKYEGDVLKITDYCRALLVVKDFPTLLALLELARDSFGPLIRRVKLSTLKSDHRAMPGGYRDCKINLELKDHICEIQVHVWPMWVVCGVDGFRHYRHCLEYSTDSFTDPYDALDGLDRKTMAELAVMAEEAVADMPLDNLEWYHEKFILDYFAECGVFLKHGLPLWAETTLRQLIKLRIESPDIGPEHHETLFLQKYLEVALRAQLGKEKEADDIAEKLATVELEKKSEKEAAEKSLWDSIFVDPKEAIDLIMDPNKKEREEEERLKKEVKASKKAWRKIRDERFKFLDANAEFDPAPGGMIV